MRNYHLVVHFVGLGVKCTEYNVQIRFPLRESQGTCLFLCMMARGKAGGQCRHEEVYMEKFLLLVVQVEITLTTAMPHGLAGWVGGVAKCSPCLLCYNKLTNI